jgi:hypothetical protein
MLNDIQITSDYMSRWVVLKRRVGAVTCQRVLKVLFYVNILQCFFVVENFTANAVSVAIGDNGNRLIFEIWWNFFYDLFSIKNVADVKLSCAEKQAKKKKKSRSKCGTIHFSCNCILNFTSIYFGIVEVLAI